MTDLDLTEAVDAGARAVWEEMRGSRPERGYLAWEEIIGPRKRGLSAQVAVALTAAAPLIDAQVRASIAAEIVAEGNLRAAKRDEHRSIAIARRADLRGGYQEHMDYALALKHEAGALWDAACIARNGATS